MKNQNPGRLQCSDLHQICFGVSIFSPPDICEKNEELDIVLMDVKMPVMSGFEATKLIKKFNGYLSL